MVRFAAYFWPRTTDVVNLPIDITQYLTLNTNITLPSFNSSISTSIPNIFEVQHIVIDL